jgi:hypothetical protein
MARYGVGEAVGCMEIREANVKIVGESLGGKYSGEG